MSDLIRGSVEIINTDNNTSDGLMVTTPDPSTIPDGLIALRGMSDFVTIDPIPTGETIVPKFTYKLLEDGNLERLFTQQTVSTPIADLMWTANTADGAPVTVYFRKTVEMSPDDISAALAYAQATSAG